MKWLCDFTSRETWFDSSPQKENSRNSCHELNVARQFFVAVCTVAMTTKQKNELPRIGRILEINSSVASDSQHGTDRNWMGTRKLQIRSSTENLESVDRSSSYFFLLQLRWINMHTSFRHKNLIYSLVHVTCVKN